MTRDVVVLATSASRPEYRRDFLTCVASPNDQIVSFSYRKKWYDPDLLADPARLERRAALVVFCFKEDPADPEFRFLPLRHATIRRLRPHDVKSVGDQTAVAVDFSLGDFVAVTDADLADHEQRWNEWLRGDPRRPRPSPNARFAFAKSGFEEGARRDQYTSWLAISHRVGRLAEERKSYFFRVVAIRPRGGRSRAPIRAVADRSAGRSYPLKTRSEYVLGLDAYSETTVPSFAEVLETTTTTELLSASEPVTETLGRATGVQLFLSTGAVQSSETAVVVLQAKEPAMRERVPRVQLVATVQPQRAAIVLSILALAIGTLLTGLSKDDLGSAGLAIVAKAAGVLTILVALFVAAQRAPGVSR